MRIGELARRTGTTARALRYYEQQGLLSSERQENGYRDYDADAVIRVRNVRYLLDIGLRSEDVRGFGACLTVDLVGSPPCDEAVGVYERRLDAVRARLHRLHDVRDSLSAQITAARTDTAAQP
ncbi:DNA-binding transcriptional MerR regulator [Actinoalloteichus hoggarensis]|uniref:HTH-type transcriptional regulator ZntR n=1 Tax=Actinoalloteichus hoggarensis TaxID=1470176 RepID=A0A221W297_9PSEU|nr:MerR family transcriptional regulator [Actinoalloteichus hoggarensis]ASO19894.1 HTH-type transcriptional regulator ZntR [Actinoalloteichus hoggarensis]MBB5919397.1 DNA-binding transcriptional MerR regulator [Actinoalloteichus hoggarensis]